MTVVLMYHGIGDTYAARSEKRYTVSESLFSQQLALLARDHRVLSYHDFLRGAGRRRNVVLTFDDGEKSIITRALPLLQQHGFTAMVFITTGWIGKQGYMSGDDLRRLVDQGWALGTHGVSHDYLTEMDSHDLREELEQSRDTLMEILGGAPVEHMSVPGGRINADVVMAARRAGYRSVSTSLMGPHGRRPNPYRVRRMMILRHWDMVRFDRIVKEQRSEHLLLQARQAGLQAAKSALGTRGYEVVRKVAINVLEKISGN